MRVPLPTNEAPGSRMWPITKGLRPLLPWNFRKFGFSNLIHKNCPRCTDLWSAYSKATTEFFRLDGKLQVAGLAHDHDAVEKLLPLTEKIAAERDQLRGQIAAHEADAHRADAASV